MRRLRARTAAPAILAGVLLLLAVSPWLPPVWLLDATYEFVQGWAILAVGFFARKRWVIGAALLAAFILFGVSMSGVQMGRGATGTGIPVRVMQANLYKGNQNLNAIIASVRAADPDILLLYEFSPGHEPLISRLGYPYHQIRRYTEADDLSLAIFSRYPLGTAAEIPGIARAAHWPVRLPSSTLEVFSVHPPIPLFPEDWAQRNADLMAAARVADASPSPAIMVGDFNTTPFSHVSRSIEHETGLRNSSRGFPMPRTWPKIAGIGLIPLDQLLTNSQVGVEDKRLGQDLGSDHLPVITIITLPAHTAQ